MNGLRGAPLTKSAAIAKIAHGGSQLTEGSRPELSDRSAVPTYGLGVSLRAMLNPAAAQARVPVTPGGDTR